MHVMSIALVRIQLKIQTENHLLEVKMIGIDKSIQTENV